MQEKIIKVYTSRKRLLSKIEDIIGEGVLEGEEVDETAIKVFKTVENVVTYYEDLIDSFNELKSHQAVINRRINFLIERLG